MRIGKQYRSPKVVTGASVPSYWLYFPIKPPQGRHFRVSIYAKYSTEEQDPRSIEDQVAFCKHFLEALGITDFEITVLCDPETSGELVYRPGIDQVRAGIECNRWDLVIVEDSSRLFRNEHACLELVGMAADHEIRIICIGDEVDTADETAARDEPLWLIGRWLTEIGFPKAVGSHFSEYTVRNVIDFIRREDHRGVQRYRATVSKKRYAKGGRTGCSRRPMK